MAENWPWESSSRAPPTSSTQTSPLQSGSSQSSHEVSAVAAELDRPTTTLAETLRTCLANAPPTEPAAAVAPGRSDPLRQPLRGSGSGSGSRTGMKRRSRASRRVPTTVVEATCNDFRETVHRLTGITTPTPVSAPVRPQPQRPYLRPPTQPTPRVPSTPRPLNPLLHITEAPPPMYPAFWNSQPQQLDPTFVKSESAAEAFEPGVGDLSSQPALVSTMSHLVSAPSGSINQTWWDPVPQTQSQNHFMNTTTTTSPFDSSGTSGAGPILHDDFDYWFRQDHTGSDYMH